MTRRDYVTIAAAINAARRTVPITDDRTERVLDHLTDTLCAALKADNPAFDPERFREATTR